MADSTDFSAQLVSDAGSLRSHQAKRRLQRIGVAIISGLLMALPFLQHSFHPIAWVAFVPWFLLIPRLTPGETWSYGILVGLAFYCQSLSWVIGITGLLGLFFVVIYSVIMGLCFRVAKLLSIRLGDEALWWILPIAFVGQEVLRSEGLSQLRLSYAALGYSQAPNIWVAQIASIGGVYLLSFLVVCANSALAFAACRRTLRSLVPIAVIAIATFIGGYFSMYSAHSGAAVFPVACIQSECPNDREYVDLARKAMESPNRPRFLVLPEHAIDGDADRPHPFVEQLSRIAREYQAYVVVGAHVRAPVGLECDYDNVALLIGTRGEIIGHQAKSVPVPFFRDGNPARNQRTFSTDVGKLGLCVCFDTDFTDITRRLVEIGAELLLVPVMNPDSWPVQQRIQQASMAQIRSIEVRRYSVRAASSGISQIVEPTGLVQCARNLEEGPGILSGFVSFDNSRTVFVAGGHYFARIVGWLFLVAVILLTFQRKPSATSASRFARNYSESIKE